MHNSFLSLQEQLRALLPEKGRPNEIRPLAGDASTRKYLRAIYTADDTVILMLYPNPGKNEEESFVEIQRFLKGNNLPVPEIMGHDPQASLLVLEDLGDDLLEGVVQGAPEEELRALYTQAIDLLLKTAALTRPETGPCRAFDLAFDIEKLMFEFRFFVTHFVQGLCGLRASQAALEILNDCFIEISHILAAEPRVFTHRDFHSRNLIFRRGKLVMLDFQDARMGPAQYDPASLLRDSYITLPENLVDDLVEYYRLKSGCADGSERFRYIFDIMSLQRNIKALGTFGYQTSQGKSFRYVSSIPRTAAYISENIGKYDSLRRFKNVVRDLICIPAGEIMHKLPHINNVSV